MRTRVIIQPPKSGMAKKSSGEGSALCIKRIKKECTPTVAHDMVSLFFRLRGVYVSMDSPRRLSGRSGCP